MAGASTSGVTLPTFDPAFNLPIRSFFVTALRERYPDLDIRPGSALYASVVNLISFAFQPFKDRLDVLRRNQSLQFFQYMLPEELDRLVANYLVDRKGALNANGTVRVYFNDAQNRTIPLEARFSTDDGRSYQPIQAVFISAADILLNFEDGLYYVDVAVQAVQTGDDSSVDAGLVTKVDGVASAVSVTNKAKFFGGRNTESNAGLALRTRKSIATRTITSPASIEATFGEEFGDSLISLQVIGFGDAEMQRDRARSFISFDEIFETAYCRKLNVSIDADGVIDTSVNPPSTNRLLAAIIDDKNTYSETDLAKINDPYFFFRLPIIRNDQTVFTSVRRGDIITVNLVDQSGGPDPDDGFYVVVDIVYAVPYIGHTTGGGNPEKTMMLILDRSFVNPQPNSFVITPGSPDLVAYEYRVSSGVNTDDFHVGGCADVYVHTSNTFEDEIIIGELFPSTHSPNFFEVPVSATTVLNPISQPWYEDGKVFQLPVITFVRVEQIDPANASLIIKELEQGKDFIYLSETPNLRFTPQERGFLRFIGSGLSGARIRVVYETNGDIQAMQDFLTTSDRRDVTKSVLVKAAQTLLTDVKLAYSGSLTSADVGDIIKSYIRSRPQGGAITINEITAVLANFGVTNIQFPVTLLVRRVNSDGIVEDLESQDRIEAARLERFTPRDSLQISQLA